MPQSSRRHQAPEVLFVTQNHLQCQSIYSGIRDIVMSVKEILLGVNVDHVATLRQARGTHYPDPLQAALLAEQAGADGITIHLREDRRHIQDHDVIRIHEAKTTKLNLEMAVTEEMISLAEKIRPECVCLVPEKREELTTEGGLDVVKYFDSVQEACQRMGDKGIEVSLFIDADKAQLDAAKACGAPVIELHTGHYADATTSEEQKAQAQRIISMSEYGDEIGLQINAGHGLHFDNVSSIAAIPQMVELNIGHFLIAEAVFIGLEAAVNKMKSIMVDAKKR